MKFWLLLGGCTNENTKAVNKMQILRQTSLRKKLRTSRRMHVVLKAAIIVAKELPICVFMFDGIQKRNHMFASLKVASFAVRVLRNLQLTSERTPEKNHSNVGLKVACMRRDVAGIWPTTKEFIPMRSVSNAKLRDACIKPSHLVILKDIPKFTLGSSGTFALNLVVPKNSSLFSNSKSTSGHT